MPIRRMRSASAGRVITSRPWISPFRQRIAAAVSTPSGAPPIPITAWTPVPGTATRDRRPRDRRRRSAGCARPPCGCRRSAPRGAGGRARRPTRSSTSRSSARASAFRLSATGAARSHAGRGSAGRDHELVHVESGAWSSPPCSAAASTAIAPAPPWRTGSCPRAGRRRCRPPVPSPRADLLADVEHRRLVALALADHDRAVDVDGLHLVAHRLDRDVGREPLRSPRPIGAAPPRSRRARRP